MGKNISKNNDLLLEALIALQIIENSPNFLPILGKRKRAANEIRDRRKVVEFIESWSDKMFQRQFRLSKQVFTELLALLESKYPTSSTQKTCLLNLNCL